jgi:hypothetical protein
LKTGDYNVQNTRAACTGIPYDAVLRGLYQDDDRIVPVIPNITKGWHEYNIRENFDKIVAASAKKGIAVGNLGMDFHGVIPEAAAGGRIPVMTSAHCLFAPSCAWNGKTDSSERSESEAEGRCAVGDLNFYGREGERKKYFLKDRKGQFYPILTDPADCGSVILSYKDTNLLTKKEDLKKAGVKRFRIYAG